MNTRPVSALILAATLCVAASVPMSAAPKSDVAIIYPVHALFVASNGDMRIERGATREDVSFAMKYESRKELSPNVWVYAGYHANLDSANDQGCGTMVITFASDRVVDLQLVNKVAVAVIAANIKFGSSATNVASK